LLLSDFSNRRPNHIAVEASTQPFTAGNNNVTGSIDFSASFQVLIGDFRGIIEYFGNGIRDKMKILGGFFKGGFGSSELCSGHHFHSACDMFNTVNGFDSSLDVLHIACSHSHASFL
jgi:hypothetical protein